VTDAGLVAYYAARAKEYEQVYEKPERQGDLARLHEIVPAFFAGRRVLDAPCGTGYWTRRIAPRAASITGVDLSPETLEIARANQPPAHPATFVVGDVYALDQIDGDFDAACVGFWWSHVLLIDLERFLNGLHTRLPAGSRVLVLDNRYVEGSNYPITRADDAGNTYQVRRLNSGAEYEVLKNFPSPAFVRETVESCGGAEVEVVELTHYWYAAYALNE